MVRFTFGTRVMDKFADQPTSGIMSKITKYCVAGCCLLIAACGSMPNNVGGEPLLGPVSRNTCSTIDWYQVGIYDGGRAAAQPERWTYLDNSCTGHGAKVERDEYFKGYAEGERRAAAL